MESQQPDQLLPAAVFMAARMIIDYVLDRETRPQITQYLNQKVECDIIADLVTRDDFSVTEAVSQTVAHVTTLAGLSDTSQMDAHLYAITIHTCLTAMSSPPSRHPKLILFLALLRDTPIPDPDGGSLYFQYDDLWKTIKVISTMADVFSKREPEGMPESEPIYETPLQYEDQSQYENLLKYENLAAFAAQASEIDSQTCNLTFWSSYHCLCGIFKMVDGDPDPTREQVRAACMWFIYGSRKIWEDALADAWSQNASLELGVWATWRSLLEDGQTRWLDEYTQELMRCALLNMDRKEEEYQQVMYDSLVEQGFDPMDLS